MTSSLEKLMEFARNVRMSAEEQEQQRRSFAYGSAAIENSDVTREFIRRAADEIAAGRKQIVDERTAAPSPLTK
ncbi:Fic family protein [Afipia massiliensis]|uniref:Fic family protein n=1 Tax=Afipia massiliensis TaxID=211460 RepID=A0A840MYN9_9BRAD|nr:hypothetical protein [Afipia massiliensis]MBB5051317.1 Fic family protein [Afipia massiliensis]